MRVFLTGTSGLIGKWTAERLLKEGHSIKGYDFSENPHDYLAPHCIIGDILDAELLANQMHSFEPDAVIHLAARCDLDGKSLEDYDANISGVRNVCAAVRTTPAVGRAIYTSSQLVCKVGHIPASDMEYCPNTIYGRSKVRTEEVVWENDGGGVEWCIVRPTTVWGPYMGQHYQSFLRHIQRGTYFHSGSGKLYKSYSYAENIAHQYYKLLTAPREQMERQVFYLADYEPLSLQDYANALARTMNRRQPPVVPLPIAKCVAVFGDAMNAIGLAFPINSFRLRNIRTEYIFDMKKTESVCGKLPKAFDEGVKETVEWFLANEANRS